MLIVHTGDAVQLEQLQQIDAIERHGTISAAAQELHISQPALSRSMQRLEHELGHSLFERSKNHVSLNHVGVIVAKHARSVLQQQQVFLLLPQAPL